MRPFLIEPGMSAQLFGILLAPLPARIADRLSMTAARLALGDLSGYGMTQPDWEPSRGKRINLPGTFLHN